MGRERVLRPLRRYLGLSGRDRHLLWRAFLALGAVDLGLRTRGFQRLVEDSRLEQTGGGKSLSREDLHRAQEYAHWLGVASRHHIVRAHCLHRAVALHRWLRGEGMPSHLQIGVRKEDGALRAHAWVELGGHLLYEQAEAVAAFTPLARGDARRTAFTGASACDARSQPVSLRGVISWE